MGNKTDEYIRADIADDLAKKLVNLIPICPYHGPDCWCVQCEAIDEANCSVRRYRENSNKLALDGLLETGLEYAREALLQHLDAHGESTPSNQREAERIRADIKRFETAKLNQKEGESE